MSHRLQVVRKVAAMPHPKKTLSWMGGLKYEIDIEGAYLEGAEVCSVDGEVWPCKHEHDKIEEGLLFYWDGKKQPLGKYYF
jgi:hypothetical protein